MREWIQLIILPIIGFVFGYYHKVVISPRFSAAERRIDNIEKDHDQSIRDITEVKNDVKWIKGFLKNGKRK